MIRDGWPRQILSPVDFSDISSAALRFGSAVARATGAKLTVLHAHEWEAPAYFTSAGAEALARQYRAAAADLDRALRQYVGRVCPACDAATVTVEGRPVDVIRRQAAGAGADLVVVGTHGRSGIDHFLMGSVAERLLRVSTVPLLTVRQAPEAPELRRILCAAGEGEAGRAALTAAAALAGRSGARLVVLRVAEGAAPGGASDVCADIPDSVRRACSVETIVRRGEAGTEILNAAEAMQADLLVVGGRRRPFRDASVLGTTTVRVVRHSPVPVLTVFERPD